MKRKRRTKQEIENLRDGVNTLYHLSSCGVSMIARHYGLSCQQVNRLLLPREEYLKDEAADGVPEQTD